MTTPPPVNHVFVDFENVNRIDPAVFDHRTLEFTLLLGPVKKKLEFEVVEQLVEHAASVHFVRLAAKGKNAVDFALAYYLGRAVLADPAGSFHLVSKDTGYDPLVQHLNHEGVQVHRHGDFASLVTAFTGKPPARPAAPAAAKPAPATAPVAPPPTPKPQPSRPALGRDATHLLELLIASSSRPSTRKRLTRHAISGLGNRIDEAHAGRLIEELCAAGKIAINAQGRVAYHIPAQPSA